MGPRGTEEERGEHSREEGYVLFGIVIGIVILGVFMVAAVPLWQKMIQREREAELIWRGYQYMQAIELYQKKYPGAYPPSFDVLVEQKFLRKLYGDPMSEDGEWNVLRQLSPELNPAQQAQQQNPASGLSSLNRSQAQTRTPGSALPGPAGATRQPTGSRFQSSLGRGASDQALGGVVGVASRSTEKTFYQVPGKEKYKDWLFVWGAQQMMVPPVQPGQPGQPGQPRLPGQPGQIGPSGQGASPFPGLPPPPALTSIGLGRGFGAPGAVPPGGVPPGQTLPGRQGQFPQQPGMGAFPGAQPQPEQGRQQQQQRRPPN